MMMQSLQQHLAPLAADLFSDNPNASAQRSALYLAPSLCVCVLEQNHNLRGRSRKRACRLSWQSTNEEKERLVTVLLCAPHIIHAIAMAPASVVRCSASMSASATTAVAESLDPASLWRDTHTLTTTAIEKCPRAQTQISVTRKPKKI